jgi:hypothetical protein
MRPTSKLFRLAARIPLAIGAGLVWGPATSPSARAGEWPVRWKALQCAQCGQPFARHFFPPNVTYSAGVPYHQACVPPPAAVPVDQGYPGRSTPVAPTAPPEAAQPGEPGPEGPSTTPGAATPPMLSGTPSTGTAPGGGGESAADAFANAENAGPSSIAGLGGGIGAPQGALNMFGDKSPIGSALFSRQNGGFRPPVPPEPPPNPATGLAKSTMFNPVIRSFKIADNQTPMPVDRFSFSFNFFDYVNQSVNQRLGVPINRIQAFRYVFGFEKVVLDGNASVGVRLPLNNVVGNSNVPGLGQSSTSLGDLSVYFKYALWIDRDRGRVLTTGMAVTMPTGPSSFAGADWARGIHFTYLQPYLAFQYAWDRLYAIGFASVEVPTSQRDVLMLYQDLGLGYYIYRDTNPNSDGFIKAIAPTFEVHVNTPTNHRDVLNPRDIAGTAEVVDLTTGLNIFMGKRTLFSLGVVDPVTGPRPFSLEALALLNVMF